jgi:hypothetical protein
MDELDKIIKAMLNSKYPASNSAEKEGCISEERFAKYLENLLAPTHKEAVEKHLSECEVCFQKSIMFSKVIDEIKSQEQPDVSREITENAKVLVREQSPGDIIEVILEFGKNIVNIIKDAADICTVPEPAALRARSGEEMEKGTNIAKLSKEFNGLKADISIEKINEAECEIEARITDPASGSLLDDIRVNLVSGEKELASYLTVKGYVYFKNLKFGNYLFKIYKGKHSIDSVLLKLLSI